MKASRRVKLSEDVSIHPSPSSSTPRPRSPPPPPPTSEFSSSSSPSQPPPSSSSPTPSPPPSPPTMPSSSSSPSSSSTSKPHPIQTLPSSPLPSTPPSSPATSKSSSSSKAAPPQPLLSRSRSLSSTSSTTTTPEPAVPVLMRGKSEGGTSKVGRLERRRKISFSAESLLIAAIQDGDTDDLLRVLRCRPVDYSNNSSCGSDGHASSAITEYDQITKQLVNQTNHTGLTPLHHGVLTNNLDAVKILLTCGADVNAQDENGFTPLHTASACGFMQVVSLLILFGADVFLLTKEAELAVDVCKDIQVIRLLSQEIRLGSISIKCICVIRVRGVGRGTDIEATIK
ncbi:protein phosphatase 1 regulatory subunit 12A-like [Octopus vulgaris]|uniref:Protein phosphatase 1 regulatory subunit 12A-like n=1 Tax=Octopus vulgaris TaxID=6645 RepID=A0AA36C0I1_OCTVU|nr:protein phosphatase 1 regulatory subunit 12A-like [Octopus vulgaris]